MFFQPTSILKKVSERKLILPKKSQTRNQTKKKLKVKTPESLGCFFIQQANRQCCIKQTLIRLGSLGVQAFPKHSQATWKKASPKPNSQPKNSENNLNQKCNPKHKAKSRLCTQKLLQQQPRKKKIKNVCFLYLIAKILLKLLSSGPTFGEIIKMYIKMYKQIVSTFTPPFFCYYMR